MIFQLRTLSVCLALTSITGIAHASGFNLLEQSNGNLGNAYAGSAAIADNASTMYYNPAGLTRLEGLQVSTGVSAIKLNFKFKDNGSSLPNGRIPFSGLGGTGGNAGGWAGVPNLYFSYKINERVAVGLGLSVPFGLKTEYDDDWMGRYHSQSFDIKTLNINPAVAFKLDPTFSVGVGLNIQRIEATYYKRALRETGVLGTTLDLGTKTKVKNTGVGWNIGLLYEPSEDTRIGLSYRSRIKHKASGDTSLSLDADAARRDALTMLGSLPPSIQAGLARQLAQLSAGLGQLPSSLDAKATVSLPDMVILSGYHRLNDKWEILGDVSWIGWSSIPKLEIRNSLRGVSQGLTKLDLRFKDAWRIAIGANYILNDSWKLKAGLAWDQSPIRKAEYRPASLPDSNRYWFSLGAQYKPTDNTTIDVGYTYIKAQKSHTNNTNGNKALYGHLKGSYKADSHIFGLQLSHRF